MSAHVSWETLNEFADNRLALPDRDAVASHLEECDDCRGALARLRRLLSSAKATATSVEPPPDAWQAIRAEIDLRKIVPLPNTVRPRRQVPWLRVAIVAGIVAASSATTVAIMNKGNEQSVVALPHDSGAPGVIPVSVRAIDRDYEETLRTLTAALEASRAKLSPETIEAVERSLRVIDEAITEVRDALLRDPASAHLRGMLTKSYEQKVDLLRRVSARTSAT
jgi:anti-sigma factor RsiW